MQPRESLQTTLGQALEVGRIAPGDLLGQRLLAGGLPHRKPQPYHDVQQGVAVQIHKQLLTLPNASQRLTLRRLIRQNQAQRPPVLDQLIERKIGQRSTRGRRFRTHGIVCLSGGLTMPTDPTDARPSRIGD